MRLIVIAAPLAMLIGLAGCDGTPAPATSPADLAPLTEAQKAEIQSEDARVEAEERGTPVKVSKTKSTAPPPSR